MNNNFKIIAIKPLESCDPKYLKILKKNQLYTFYNDFKFSKDCSTIEYCKSVPSSLFDIGGGNPRINVSAIVGKNGSGKSTITDMLLMAINNISFVFKELKEIQTVGLEPVPNLYIELYCLIDDFYKIRIENNHIDFFKYSFNKNTYCLQDQSIWGAFFKERSYGFSIRKKIENSSFNLSQFFYTICVNYSHYALNSTEMGDWVHNIFFKNDAYQAPLVVNPFRDEGNVDINSENYLLKSRLLAYLLPPENNGKHRYFTPNQYADKAIFKLNENKFAYAYKKEWFSPEYKNEIISFEEFDYDGSIQKEIINLIEKQYKISKVNSKSELYFQDEIEKYIVRKIISICRTYHIYRHFFDEEKGIFREGEITINDNIIKANLELLVKQLYQDDSHVTFKLNQAINYLKYFPLNKFIDKNNLDKDIIVSFDDLYSELNSHKAPNDDIINYLPPAIFDFDIELGSKVYDKSLLKKPRFSSLSSGEKQRIYSVYSILYHLKNIDSVLKSDSLIKYSKINLLFEEVELYFHPEMQKGLISYLLTKIADQVFFSIEDINICFVTHSPFILSDIPESNILFLDVEDGKAIPKIKPLNTFAANIHKLLADGFFMKGGLMGDFALQKINDVLKFIKDPQRSILNKSDAQEIIDLIGEPILKNKLDSLLNKRRKNETELEYYKRRISEIEEKE